MNVVVILYCVQLILMPNCLDANSPVGIVNLRRARNENASLSRSAGLVVMDVVSAPIANCPCVEFDDVLLGFLCYRLRV